MCADAQPVHSGQKSRSFGATCAGEADRRLASEISRRGVQRRFFTNPIARLANSPLVLAILILLAGEVFLAVAAFASPTDPTKRVLVIESFGRYIAPFSAVSAAFRTTLARELGAPLDINEAPFDTARFDEPKQESLFVDFLQRRFADRRLDLVVPINFPAASFAVRHRNRLFPDTPMLIASVERRRLPPDSLTRQTTVVPSRLNVPGFIEHILELLPETKNIVVIFGASPLEKFWLGEFRREFQKFTNRVAFTWLNELSFEEIKKRAAAIPPNAVIFYGLLVVDAAGVPYEYDDALKSLRAVANAPIFGLFDKQLGLGVVGGRLLSHQEIGVQAARVALRILRGEVPSDIPIKIGDTSAPVYDWRELKRWGISERRLPPGSMVKFRPPSMWEQYRWTIVGALAVIAVQAGLIVGLLLHRARRYRAEKQLRESQEFMELSTSAADLGLWVRDLEHDEISVNHRLRSLFGFGQHEVLRFDDVVARIHPDDRARVMTEIERTQKTGISFEEEFRVMVSEGSERWVAARGRTVGEIGESGARRMGVVFDITERKQAEQDLKAALVEIRGLKERLEEENIYLKEEIFEVKGVDEIVGKSDALKYVLTRVEQVAQTDTTVLLLGETGVGKELIAQAIHEKSSRSNRPLIKINCATLPEALVESELFGHERGAFTGADRQRKGRFELADGGTILLDEVGELAAGTQAKLLRVLQEGEFERVGGSKTMKVNVRVIAATNRKLHEEVSAGRFRQDLFYRLNVYPITVPPLRYRQEDIPLLVSYFGRQIGDRQGKSITEVPAQVMRELTRYGWPGNIRELQNVIERAVIVSSDGVLRLPEPLLRATTAPANESRMSNNSTTVSTLDEAEREHILRALEATGWRINGPKGAAAMLKMHPSTLRFRMKKLGLTKVLSYTSQTQKSNLH